MFLEGEVMVVGACVECRATIVDKFGFSSGFVLPRSFTFSMLKLDLFDSIDFFLILASIAAFSSASLRLRCSSCSFSRRSRIASRR